MHFVVFLLGRHLLFFTTHGHVGLRRSHQRGRKSHLIGSPTKMNIARNMQASVVVSGKSVRSSKKSYLDSGPSQEQIDRRNLVKQKLRLGELGGYGDTGRVDQDNEVDYLKAQLEPSLPPPPPSDGDSHRSRSRSRDKDAAFNPSADVLRRKSITPRTQMRLTKRIFADNDIAPPPPPPPSDEDGHRSRSHSRDKDGGVSPSVDVLRRKSITPRTQMRLTKRIDADYDIASSTKSTTNDNKKNTMKILSGMASSEHGVRSSKRESKGSTKAPQRNSSFGSFGGFNRTTFGNSSSHSRTVSSSSYHSRSPSFHHDSPSESYSPSSFGRKLAHHGDEMSEQPRAPRRIKSLSAHIAAGNRNGLISNHTNTPSVGGRQRHGDASSTGGKPPARSFSWGGKELKPIRRTRSIDASVPHPFPDPSKNLVVDRDSSDTEETIGGSSYSSRSAGIHSVNHSSASPGSLHKNEDIYKNAVRRAQERQTKKNERQQSPSIGSALRPTNPISKPKTARECDDFGFVSADESEDDDDGPKRKPRLSSGGPPSPAEPGLLQRGLMALEQLYGELNAD